MGVVQCSPHPGWGRKRLGPLLLEVIASRRGLLVPRGNSWHGVSSPWTEPVSMCVHLTWGSQPGRKSLASVLTRGMCNSCAQKWSWSCIGTPQLGESGRKGKVALNCPQNASVGKSQARWNLCVLEHARAWLREGLTSWLPSIHAGFCLGS